MERGSFPSPPKVPGGDGSKATTSPRGRGLVDRKFLRFSYTRNISREPPVESMVEAYLVAFLLAYLVATRAACMGMGSGGIRARNQATAPPHTVAPNPNGRRDQPPRVGDARGLAPHNNPNIAMTVIP